MFEWCVIRCKVSMLFGVWGRGAICSISKRKNSVFSFEYVNHFDYIMCILEEMDAQTKVSNLVL